MSVSDTAPAQPTPPPPVPPLAKKTRRTWRDWMTIGVGFCLLAIPFYLLYWLYARISFKPEIDRLGGHVKLEVVGPRWFGDLIGPDFAWLLGTPVEITVPSQQMQVGDRWV